MPTRQPTRMSTDGAMTAHGVAMRNFRHARCDATVSSRLALFRTFLGVALNSAGHSGILVVVVVVVVVLVSGIARGRETAPESTCPTREAIEASVRSLLGGSPVEGGKATPEILVRDRGDQYTVSVKGSTRDFRDEGRDCDARARAAAVFVALMLSPTSEPPPPPPEAGSTTGRDTAVPRPLPIPPAPISQTWTATIEVGAVVAAAPRTSGLQRAAGGELRLIVSTNEWGLSLGGALTEPSRFDASAVPIRETRHPVDVDIRRTWRTRWFATAVELGALGAFCRVQQADIPDARAGSHLELGVHAAATWSAHRGRFGLYIRGFSEIIPFTRQVAVEPRGIIGRTSPIWVGGGLGLAVRFY